MSKSRQSTASRNVRRLAIVVCLSSATGCASGGPSLASLNPFSKSTPDVVSTPAERPAVTGAAADLAQNTRGQASSMSMAIKSAYGKGRDSVTGLFGGETVTETSTGETLADNDPLLLKNKPTSVGADVFVANGQLWESTGNFERAMDNYSKALEKDPNSGPALASIARLNYRQERFDQAVDFFNRAIAAVPNEAGLYNDLGLTLSRMGRHDEAVVAIGKALAVAPGTSRYANNLATVQFEAGREEEARATLMRHNKPAVAHYNMAYLLHSAHRNDQALKELSQVLAMGPSAESDSASQRAIQKSKELFEKLGGPASQFAQALPQVYGAASDSSQAVSRLAGDAGQVVTQLRNRTSGFTAQLSDTVAPASGTSTPAAGVQSPYAQVTGPLATGTQATGAPRATATATSAPFTNPLAGMANVATAAPAPAATAPVPATPQSTAFSLPPGIELPPTQIAEGQNAKSGTR